jgi:hypothetical protein
MGDRPTLLATAALAFAVLTSAAGCRSARDPEDPA